MSSRGEDEHIPAEVKDFVLNLNHHLINRNVREIERLYVVTFNKITERLYKASTWPSAEVISPLVQGNVTFLLLYKQLYYRHVFSHVEITIDHRFESFTNIINLLNFILQLSLDHPEIKLPNAWLWDIVDEFITEFQCFHDFRGGVKSLTQHEIDILRPNEHAWSGQTVLRYLEAISRLGSVSEVPAQRMFKDLAQFALVGLVRVNTLLCDYFTVLELADEVDLKVISSVGSASVSYHYTLGLSYLMLRRYSDSVNTFRAFISRSGRYKGQDRDTVTKHVNLMQGLLALTTKLAPEYARDDSLRSLIQDKFGEQLREMDSRDSVQAENAFKSLFKENSPGFVNSTAPNYDGNVDSFLDLSRLQLNVLVRELQQRVRVESVLTNLKLCKAVSVPDLARFATDSSGANGEYKIDEASIGPFLLSLKHKSRTLNKTTSSSSNAVLADQAEGSGSTWGTGKALDFVVKDDIVYVKETTKAPRYGQFFYKHSIKLDNLLNNIEHLKM